MPIGPPLGGSKGDAEAALAQAAHRVDATFVTPPQNHNALEPHGCTVVWTGSGRDAQVTVWDGSQNVDWVKRHLARTFGLAPGQVRVISEHVGGAFGGRTMVWAHTVLAALAARETGRPVRLQLTREGVYRTVGGRSPSIQRVALSAGDDGRLTALIHTAQLRKGAVGGAAEQVVSCSHDLYDASAMRLGTQLVSMDLLPNQVMRAPGEANGTFALESALDMLAASTGLDPIELRRRNLAPSRGPIDGKEFSQRRILEAFDVATSAFGWADRPVAPRSMRDGRWLVGWGAATAFHPAWQFPAHLRLSVAATGTVTLECAFHELGMGAPTAVAQLVADRLDVPLPAVEVRYGDTSLPTGPGAGGSGQSASIAASVDVASRRLVATLDRLGRRTDGGAFGDGRSAHERYTEIVRRSGRDEVTVELGPRSGLAATWSGLRDTVKLMRDQRRWLKAAAGAQLCEVRVDADTGEVRVTRWVGAYDIGRVINAKTAASQIRGGVVMGIGLALTEATLVDPRRGRIMNPSLTEYHVPVHADVPPIEVHLLDHPDPQTPLGILGAGEVGITGAGAAVANAIWHATGSRVTELPITLDAVLPRPAGS
nr:xanthine dehydrogenase family protein molybdopterin-binding subunit [Jiangella mangrovi]